MANFQNLLQEFQKLNLKPWEYAITWSWPLAIRRIREAQDLDVLVEKSIYEELVKKYPSHIVNKVINSINCGNLLNIWNLEIWCFIFGETEKVNEIINKAEIIDWFAFMNLDYTLWFKSKLNREKDLRDIEAIEKYLKNI